MMTSRRDILKWSTAAAGSALVGLPFRRAEAQSFALAIVVSRDSPIEALTEFELERLYLGSRILDPSGEPIVPFNQAAKLPDRVAFEANVLGMSPEQAVSYWIDRKIRGQSGAPKALGSADLVQRVVSRMDHAITYVSLQQMRSDVRFIAVDGKVPTDAAYDLFVERAGPSRAKV
jgi:hypothetical protein